MVMFMFESVMLNVFISYSKKDINVVDEIKHFLQSNNCNIYYVNQDLTDSNNQEIIEQIRKADIFIPVLTNVGLKVSYSLSPFINLPIFANTVFQIDGIIVSSAASISYPTEFFVFLIGRVISLFS